MKCWFSRESAPLLTNQLFDAVRARLNPKKTIQRKLNDEFPLRGVVRCATYGKLLTGGWIKGRPERYPLLEYSS